MKNLSKRMKNAIIQGFVFNTIVFLGFFIAVFVYIIPTYMEISSKKEELSLTTSELQQVQTQGISYEEFKAAAQTDYKGNAYLKTILSDLDEDFYTQNFQNTSGGSYEEFFQEKKQKILEMKTSDEYTQRLKLLADILPFYGDIQGGQGSISDFEFINNLENILFSFNLISNDPIGVRNLEPLSFGNLSNDEKENSDAGASMYIIPVSLSLTGQKKDILDFLHYIENVWKIEIENGKIAVYQDNYLTRFSKNIYKSQLTDIESIIFPDYIDSSPEPVSTDLVTFINATQAREKYTIDVSLRFYVAGLPKYKIEAFIQSIVVQSRELTTLLWLDLKKYQAVLQKSESGAAISIINEMKSLNFLLQEITAGIQELQKKQFQVGVSIDEVYKEALSFEERLTKIEQYYQKYVKQLETIKNY